MSLPRFLIPTDAVVKSQTGFILTGREAHHLLRVRRLRPGNLVKLIDGSGRVAKAAIVWEDGTRVGLDVEDVRKQQEDCLLIELIVALLKSDRMNWMIQKVTELGVHTICPVITRRSVSRLYGDKAEKRLARWKEIARQTLKQCNGGLAPTIYPPVPLKDALGRVSRAGAKILLSESEEKRSLFSAWKNQGNVTPVAVVVGPEGGLSEEEVLACERAGFCSAGMGPRTLRAETAAISAVAALAAMMTSGLEEKG